MKKLNGLLQFPIKSHPPFWPVLCLAGMFIQTAGLRAQAPGRSLDEAMHHLGDSEIKDWPGISEQPEGTSFQFKFTARENSQPVTLGLRQRDVDGGWHLKINGREISELRRQRPQTDCYYEVPTGGLRDGENLLEVVPDNSTDDIAVGRFALHEVPLRPLLHLQTLNLRVTEAGSGEDLPARVSIQTENGLAPDIYYPSTNRVAIREGLIYVYGSASLEVPAGKYRVAATRGMEWSRDEQPVDLSGGSGQVHLELRREVDTTGFVAADTHIHTYTFSGHGDATVDERVLSLAGEGVELAVATDHNHNTDFRPNQEKLALNDYFTAATGNEVTTPNGHFNGFPLKPGDEVPPHKETNWVKVVSGIRLKGAKVVILNHPRWPKIDDSPFSRFGLNRATGDRASGTPFTFDAMELVNATVNSPDPLYLFRDWFALLNAGEKISAVGATDSHTVDDPVGQGRTYIPSSTDDPAKLNVDELCDNLLKGRATVSLGIFCETTINEKYSPGDLVPVNDGKVNIRLRVAAPGWIHPRQAMIFINGEQKAVQDVPADSGKPTNASLSFELPIHGVDAHLVCVVLGDGVKYAGWKTLNHYTLAATNPVFLDVNHDGEYNTPRDSARRIITSIGGDIDGLINTLEVVPPPIGVQILALTHEKKSGVELVRLNQAVKRLAEFDPLYALYRSTYDATHPAPAK